MQAYAVCIGVMPGCRQTESETVGDGWGCADEAYHDNGKMIQIGAISISSAGDYSTGLHDNIILFMASNMTVLQPKL